MSIIARLFGVETVTPDEVDVLIARGGVHVFDANPARVWAQGHVPTARNIDPAEFDVSSLPADKQVVLIFYCSGPMCGAGPHAARRAKKHGYSRAYVMSAGITGWTAAGKPLEMAGSVG